MSKRWLISLAMFVFIPAVGKGQAEAFFGQDLHLSGKALLSTRGEDGEHILVFEDGFSMSIGAGRFASDRAVVRLEAARSSSGERAGTGYKASVYLKGNVERGAGGSGGRKAGAGELSRLGIESKVIANGEALVIRFDVSGEIFVTSEKRTSGNPEELQLYKEASVGFQEIREAPGLIERGEAVLPEPAKYEELPSDAEKIQPMKAVKEVAEKQEQAAVAEAVKHEVKPAAESAEAKRPGSMYAVNMAPVGKVEPKIESTELPDGARVTTVIGRFYLWQRQDERGRLLEMEADSAVVYHGRSGAGRAGVEGGLLGGGEVRAVYMSGDVVLTEGQRVIRADEMYYDFEGKQALAINGVMRNFDSRRGIPIYVRAAKIRQLAENRFAAENITLTSSEFYRPQISLSASRVVITDTTPVDEQEGRVSDSSYDARLYDVRMKLDDTTIFYWPYMRSNLQRPDIPLKSVRVHRDRIWGTSIETRWYLARLLGLREPRGTESTFALDYFGKRGVGVGAEVRYSRENYFGNAIGYIIKDSGKDRLGRHASRRDVKPRRRLRGRFSSQHRHFLPYNWQLTTGLGYVSDEYFIEGYYRGEYNVGMNETYIHMKRLEDNWAVSLLTKGRINDFADELEELPSTEYHLTGESVFGDRFTFYSDTQVSRLRQRIGNEHTTLIDENMFLYVSHRSELDMPVRADGFYVVPFVAGTFGYDDRSGFTRSLVDGSNTGSFGKNKVWIGEVGVRVSGQPYWKVYPDVKSRLWDLNKLRHIIRPHVTAVAYKESDSVVKQRDTLSAGISQRLQTKRGGTAKRNKGRLGTSGPEDGQRTVDWMRLDMDVVWVDDPVSATEAGPGPDKFIWSRPLVPLDVFSTPGIYSGDLIESLHRFGMYGPRRNYFSADYRWRVSDTSAVLSDINVDMQSGVVQQLNVGLSRLRWPNLSYYIGSRYLRRIQVLDEKGSNALTFSATYKLDPRYTAVFSQQFDFDYGANIRSDFTLIRKYHRMYMSLTYSADESLKRHAIVFSIWPQGVPELAIGRSHMGIGGAAGY